MLGSFLHHGTLLSCTASLGVRVEVSGSRIGVSIVDAG